MAARHNPTLLAAMETMEQYHSLFKESFNGILPQINLSNSYTQSSSAHVSVGSNGSSSIISDNSQVWQAGLTASLDLVDFGQYVSIENALSQYHQYQANIEVAGNNVLLSLYQAFAALMYAQEEVHVDSDIRDTWKINADMVGLRYASGTESKGDNMNTQAQLLQSELNLVQAGRDVLVAQQQLSTAVGLDDFEAMVVTGTWTAPPAPAPLPNFEALVEREPAVKVQVAQVEEAENAVKSGWALMLPTLGINYSRGRSGNTEIPLDPYWTVTGSLRYPLFSGGITNTYYTIQAAKRSLDSAHQQLRNVRTQALSTLMSAWSGYAKAQDQVTIQRALLDAALQQDQEYTVLYQGGLYTYQQWILVVQSYVGDEISYLQAEQSLIDAEAQWRFAAGEKLGPAAGE
jgi:outer membrane protein TolC